MNQMERMKRDLSRRFPGFEMNLDAPDDERGAWWLFVQRPGFDDPLSIEWRPGQGFGLSVPDDGDYGTGPDEVYTNVRAAFDRAVELLESGSRTDPSPAVCLSELRQMIGLSQAELAQRTGVSQGNISKIENRCDVLVSTLASIIASMEGELILKARFADGTERELKYGAMTAPPSRVKRASALEDPS